MATIIWPGSGSNPSGSTPFGLYDTELKFQSAGPRVADWCAIRLGYPIVEVEMLDINFYTCFEEAITEYSSQVNQFNIRSNISLLQGAPTGSSLTHKNVQGSPVPYIVRLSDSYGAEAGVGGSVEWKQGSIGLASGSQVYDLKTLWADVSESGANIEIKRIFQQSKPAISRFFDPYSLSGQGYINLIDEFGFGGYSPAAQFILMPVWEDVLRVQAIEFNDQVRKSAFSFEVINNKLRIFPIPRDSQRLFFDYIVESDRDNQFISSSAQGGLISDYSNAPYTNMVYADINDVGVQWIRRYTLALAKDLLGSIRSKYASIPIPDGDVTLDGSELRSEAQAEKEALIAELRENLEDASRKAQMEQKADESDQHQRMLNKIPLLIYIG